MRKLKLELMNNRTVLNSLSQHDELDILLEVDYLANQLLQELYFAHPETKSHLNNIYNKHVVL